jgi:hypothetical protein
MFLLKKYFQLFLVAFLLLLSSCSKNADDDYLAISFDASLKTDKGVSPIHDSGNHTYASYRDRKVLLLKGNENIHYDVSMFDLNQGSLSFWIKVENSLDENESTIISLVGKYKKPLQIRAKDHFVYVDGSGKGFQLKRKISQQGSWANVALVWDISGEQVSLYLNGVRFELKASTPKQGQVSDGLIIGDLQNSPGFAVLMRDLKLYSSVLSDRQIASSFESDIHKMQSPIKWSAEKLEHYAGKKVFAQGTANGNAWTTDTMFASRKPIQLNQGNDYTLEFRIKPLTHIAQQLIQCEIWKLYNGKKTAIRSWANSKNDLMDAGKYKTFSLNFHVENGSNVGYTFYSWIPSKYSLLLDTIVLQSKNSEWKDLQRAEDLEHTMGVWMKDDEASSGRAWSNANTLLYGPYTSIGQPGKYRVSWRIKLSDWVPANEPLMTLDVYAHDAYLNQGRRGTRSYGKIAVGASEFKTPHVWEEKSIDFRYDGANMIEFRAHAKYMKPDAVLLDTVEVQYLGRT